MVDNYKQPFNIPLMDKKQKYLLFFLVFLLGIGACSTGPDENRLAVDAFLEKEVEERIATYREILFQKCREDILEEAGEIVDSILITEARLQRDSTNKPPKPEKPEKPELKMLKDSLSLDPLFRDSMPTN